MYTGGKNCGQPWIKELLTKKTIFFDIFGACGSQFSFRILSRFANAAESQAVFWSSISELFTFETLLFFDQSQQPKYFKYSCLKREVKVARNIQLRKSKTYKISFETGKL